MTTSLPDRRAPRLAARPCPRLTLGSAHEGSLVFSQVREDPLLEIEALRPAFTGTTVIVSSAGCTALSLLAAGARRIVAVDLSRVQNHLVELKYAAVRAFPASTAIAFLGAQPMPRMRRLQLCAMLLPLLTPEARAYWSAHPRSIARGVLRAGRSERFIALVATVVRLGIARRHAVRALLAATSLEAQRDIFERSWNGPRWHALFRLLLNRWSMSRAYHSSFFAHVENRSFARHFRALAERGITTIPARSNYFLHEMLTGRYPVEEPGGVPPYLDGSNRGAEAADDPLTLIDGTLTDALRQQPSQSVDGVALSNICEWMSATDIDRLFAEIARTAKPGARVVFRNFVGWTDIPARWRHLVVERVGHGEDLIARDRSLVQSRLVVCDVRGNA
jgi:S-adenosylmethionine-diacylglycerol 3-amino-3-carboxypropyl transferase